MHFSATESRVASPSTKVSGRDLKSAGSEGLQAENVVGRVSAEFFRSSLSLGALAQANGRWRVAGRRSANSAYFAVVSQFSCPEAHACDPRGGRAGNKIPGRGGTEPQPFSGVIAGHTSRSAKRRAEARRAVFFQWQSSSSTEGAVQTLVEGQSIRHEQYGMGVVRIEHGAHHDRFRRSWCKKL